MGENYTRKTENYTIRQNRQQNAQGVSAPQNKKAIFTCWKCHKDFDLPVEKAKPDTVWCPHCEMIHGHITNFKDN